MLGLAIATSYAPAVLRPPDDWPRLHSWLTNGAPQPFELDQETPDVVADQARRVEAAFTELRAQLRAYRPTALVLLASDYGRVFGPVHTPQLCTFLGNEIWASTRFGEIGEPPEDIVRLPCDQELAAFLHRELIDRGFDMNYSKTLRPLLQPDYGSTPAFVVPTRALAPELDVPVVPLYVNTRRPPAPNGHRCYALGQALADILSERTERVALLAAGGLSHDHHGPRAGWLDEPLDRWLLDQLARGRASAATTMYDLESDALRGGGAEMRLWIIAAGAAEAMGGKAVLVDYVPSLTAATGLGFAYWPLPVR